MTQRILLAVLIALACAQARANVANFNAIPAGSSYAAPAIFSDGGLDFDVLFGLGNLNVSAVSGQVNPSFSGNYARLTSNTGFNVNLPTGASQIQFDFIRNTAGALVVNGSWLDTTQIPATINGVRITNSLPTKANWGSITATGSINTFFIVGTDFLVDNFNAALIPGLAGDYNKNRIVDAGDYVLQRKSLNSRTSYNSWRSNFGAVSPPVGSGASTGIPEPSTLALLIVGLPYVAWERRRKRAPPNTFR